MTLVHHELCFGCGQTNLFGLLMEVERQEGGVAGRWFVKQDHQGPARGFAHPGIVACALTEAVMLAAGDGLEVAATELELHPGAAVPVGAFCDVEAMVSRRDGTTTATATASVSGVTVARSRATLRSVGSPEGCRTA